MFLPPDRDDGKSRRRGFFCPADRLDPPFNRTLNEKVRRQGIRRIRPIGRQGSVDRFRAGSSGDRSIVRVDARRGDVVARRPGPG